MTYKAKVAVYSKIHTKKPKAKRAPYTVFEC